MGTRAPVSAPFLVLNRVLCRVASVARIKNHSAMAGGVRDGRLYLISHWQDEIAARDKLAAV